MNPRARKSLIALDYGIAAFSRPLPALVTASLRVEAGV